MTPAVEHHLLEVVAHPVDELLHAERLGPVGGEVGPLLQEGQHVGLGQVRLRDGQVHVQQAQQLSGVVQVVGREAAEAVIVQVANGHGGEDQAARHHGVHAGHVRVGEEVGQALGALQDQEAQAGQQGRRPQQAAHAGLAVREDEAQAVQRAGVGEGLPGGGVRAGALAAPLTAAALLQIHRQPSGASAREALQVHSHLHGRRGNSDQRLKLAAP
ncbi:hypothetical protein EYF80_029015 [Liparis tanakae]|uniref:Uncharacterized protein n=1 Tax=Liparis tanakae TaxID=230148 RepID=A0A4Z2H567_9TELE|nr:hypothetical protein EYF80_029015 [Liparis tanakae]